MADTYGAGFYGEGFYGYENVGLDTGTSASALVPPRMITEAEFGRSLVSSLTRGPDTDDDDDWGWQSGY